MATDPPALKPSRVFSFAPRVENPTSMKADSNQQPVVLILENCLGAHLTIAAGRPKLKAPVRKSTFAW